MNMSKLTDELVKIISDENPRQKKYLNEVFRDLLSDSEKNALEQILVILSEEYSIEELASDYLMLISDTMLETKFFIENGRYRYSSLKEVNEKVYQNEEYMTRYMMGLLLSGYLWKNHIEINRWYRKTIKTFQGSRFLEIGPGHGLYFLEAVSLGRFDEYTGIDLSQSSINLANKYLNDNLPEDHKKFELICGDINTYEIERLFDAVCMSEVLEHVEKPEELLKRIYDITTDKPDIYISVPINAPEIDHIFLFRSIDDVLSLVEKTGFRVCDSFYVTSNGTSYEKALKKRIAVNLALHLTK